MKIIFDNRVLIAYLDAIRMEFEQESTYHNFFNINDNLKYLPRLYTFRKKIEKFDSLIRCLIPVLMIFWLILLYPIRVIYSFFKNLFHNLAYKNIELGDVAYFDASDKKYFSFIDQNDNGYPDSLLFLPYKVDHHHRIPNIKYVNLFNITSTSLLIKSAIYSLIFIWKLALSSDRKLILFGYSAFKWFWVYFALKKSKIKSIWISNHYDRWTVLASNLPEIGVTMIQHGQLFFHDHINNNIELSPVFSKKIKNVKKIYAFSPISEQFFKKFIEDGDISFLRLRSKMKIIDWRKQADFMIKILIIGNHHELNFQMKIANRLLEVYPGLIDICYKYHPSQKNRVTNNIIWEERSKNRIPRADIVLSYGSSIDDEIAQHLDANIVHYDFRKPEEINIVLNKIMEIINKKLSNNNAS